MKKKITAIFAAAILLFAAGCSTQTASSSAAAHSSSVSSSSYQTTDYLPLGSIVTLVDSSNKIMISGYASKDSDGSVWDYCGILYPDGYTDASKLYRFNRSQVSSIVSDGYTNDDMKTWLSQIKNRMQARG